VDLFRDVEGPREEVLGSLARRAATSADRFAIEPPEV
jgi:hypothetical protein